MSSTHTVFWSLPSPTRPWGSFLSLSWLRFSRSLCLLARCTLLPTRETTLDPGTRKKSPFPPRASLVSREWADHGAHGLSMSQIGSWRPLVLLPPKPLSVKGLLCTSLRVDGVCILTVKCQGNVKCGQYCHSRASSPWPDGAVLCPLLLRFESQCWGQPARG